MAHPDNTFKALKGEEMFVERWQCRFGWHRWSRWSNADKDGSLTFKQHRHCVDCGRIEGKRILGISRAY